MSLLAAPRRRQVISANPQGKSQNEEWKQFGRKLMSKSGWQDGDGLGRERHGPREPVAMKFKDDSRGLGCTFQYENNWLAHGDDYNSLLQNLNQQHGLTEAIESSVETSSTITERVSLEEKSKTLKGRIHYHKFARGKDLISKSVEDVSAIFGGKLRKNKNRSPSVSNEAESPVSAPEEPTTAVTGLQTIESKDNIQEYFAKKMALVRKKANTNFDESSEMPETSDQVNTDMQSEAEQGSKKKKSKKKQKYDENPTFVKMEEDEPLADGGDGSTDNPPTEEASDQSARKKHKRMLAAHVEINEVTNADLLPTTASDDVAESAENASVSKKRKKKRVKQEDHREESADTTMEETTDSHNLGLKAVEGVTDVKTEGFVAEKKQKRKIKTEDRTTEIVTDETFQTTSDDLTETIQETFSQDTLVTQKKKGKKQTQKNGTDSEFTGNVTESVDASVVVSYDDVRPAFQESVPEPTTAEPRKKKRKTHNKDEPAADHQDLPDDLDISIKKEELMVKQEQKDEQPMTDVHSLVADMVSNKRKKKQKSKEEDSATDQLPMVVQEHVTVTKSTEEMGESIKTETNVSATVTVTRPNYSLAMQTVRTRIQKMTEEEKQQVFPGANIFGVVGYGDHYFM